LVSAYGRALAGLLGYANSSDPVRDVPALGGQTAYARRFLYYTAFPLYSFSTCIHCTNNISMETLSGGDLEQEVILS